VWGSGGMTVNTSSASLAMTLGVPAVWAASITNVFIMHMSIVSWEPIYEPVLVESPYSLDVTEIGEVASVPSIALVIGIAGVGVWLHRLVGVSGQQLTGILLMFVGTLLLGPSPILGVQASVTQLVVALVVLGISAGILAAVNPVFVLRSTIASARLPSGRCRMHDGA